MACVGLGAWVRLGGCVLVLSQVTLEKRGWKEQHQQTWASYGRAAHELKSLEQRMHVPAATDSFDETL